MMTSTPDSTHISDRQVRPVHLRLQISLEHSFHLLLNGRVKDARHQLSVAESWRHGNESAIQHKKTELIHAYKGLLDYVMWCDKKSTINHAGKVIRHPKQLLFTWVNFCSNDVSLPPTSQM